MKESEVACIDNSFLKKYIVTGTKEGCMSNNGSKLRKLCATLLKKKFTNKNMLADLDVPSLFAGISFFNFCVGLHQSTDFPVNLVNDLLSLTLTLLCDILSEHEDQSISYSSGKDKYQNETVKSQLINLLTDLMLNLLVYLNCDTSSNDHCTVKILVGLLNYPDVHVVQRLLCCLIYLSQKKSSRTHLTKIFNSNLIIKLLSTEDEIQKRLVVCLIYTLIVEDEYFKNLSTNQLILAKFLSLISNETNVVMQKQFVKSQMNSEDTFKFIEVDNYFIFLWTIEKNAVIENLAPLQTYIVLCLEKLIQVIKCQKILRNHNGITVLLKCLNNDSQIQPKHNNNNNNNAIYQGFATLGDISPSLKALQLSGSCTNEKELVYTLDRYTIQCNASICAILAELALNDFYAEIIARENGIYLIGSQLLIREDIDSDSKESRKIKPALEVTSELANQLGPTKLKHDFLKINLVNIRHLYANAFCALRRLFMSEHNRRLIKSFLPSLLLSELVEIDITSTRMDDYKTLLSVFESLNDEERNELKIGILSCDIHQTPTHSIREYSITELLGTGAYGKVYKATKENVSSISYAVKEVSTSQVFFGKNFDERQKCINRILNEVNIIRQQLRHPNIVRYYKTFLHCDHLYIVMELLEGVSLTELLLSMKEKNTYFIESRVWHIFIQLILGIRYLHKEKKILHRDLSSNNIMISEGDKATITDFGLAYHKNFGSCETKSTVGTLVYACPEIVQNLPYDEGADIWALGCILYQMCTFISPFQGECILSTASRIVKGEYESVKVKCSNRYSNLIDEVIRACLNPDPRKRPDIIGVAAYLTDNILSHLDASHLKCLKLKGKLKEFQNTFMCNLCSSSNTFQQNLMKLDKNETEIISDNLSSDAKMNSNPENKSAKQSAIITPTVIINQKNLRQINDPMLGMVSVMHKLGYLTQELPSNVNSKYQIVQYIVQSYQCRLFASGVEPISMKTELFKLASYSSECVNEEFLEANIYTLIKEFNNQGGDSLLSILEEFLPDMATIWKETNQINYAILMHLIDLLLKELTTYFQR
ncbi:unnamed protein product [Trichobilharzia szidati]|nr:unnamed protein product [Trichobilharzia szidati]